MTERKVRRLSWEAVGVVRWFLQQPTRAAYGLEIARETGIPSGTLYPILARLRERGVLTDRWEQIDPKVFGRPRRRMYQLDPRNMAETQKAVAETVVFTGETPDELRRRADVLESLRCTGITAMWCPVHGDCTCGPLLPLTVSGERTLNDDDCPLHSPESAHGVSEGV